MLDPFIEYPALSSQTKGTEVMSTKSIRLWASLAVLSASALCASLARQQPGAMQAFHEQDERMSARVLYSTGDRSPGNVFMDYGASTWKKEYEQQFDAMTKGKRVRIGKGFWTCLDTNVPLTSGKAKVTPGFYYCALERSADDKWSFVLLDPNDVRAMKLDAFQSDHTKGGTVVELTHEMVKDSVTKLSIALTAAKDDAKQIALEITWGTHKLSAQLAAQL